MHQTTHFDCLIVGGGVIGMLTARELALAGLKVGLVEKSQTGREATWAGGGILSSLYPWRYPAAITELAAWGQANWPRLAQELAAETGIDPEYQQNGLLILDSDEQQQAHAWAQQWQTTLQVIDKKEILALEPVLTNAPEQALWLPQIGQVRNPRLAQSLRKSLLINEVTLIEQTEVSGILAKGQTVGVKTPGGEHHADKVIIAGGAWSANLLASTGVNLPVKPIRGQMILFKTEADWLKRITLSQDRYVIPRRDGRVLVGSTLEDVGFDKTTSEAALAELHAEAVRIFPRLADYPVEHHWAGLRPGSPEGIPYICTHPAIENLYINTGHFRYGVVLGPASARVMADLILKRENNFNFGEYGVKKADIPRKLA